MPTILETRLMSLRSSWLNFKVLKSHQTQMGFFKWIENSVNLFHVRFNWYRKPHSNTLKLTLNLIINFTKAGAKLLNGDSVSEVQEVWQSECRSRRAVGSVICQILSSEGIVVLMASIGIYHQRGNGPQWEPAHAGPPRCVFSVPDQSQWHGQSRHVQLDGSE